MKKEFSDVDFEMFVMPFGVHSTKTWNEIPAGYLLWLYDQKDCPEIISAYCDLNADELYDRKIEETEEDYGSDWQRGDY